MAKIFIVALLVIFLGGSMLLVRYAKDSYKLLPIDQPNGDAVRSNYFEWHEYVEPHGNFKVFFPSIPDHFTESSIDKIIKTERKNDAFLSQSKEGSVYLINQITYPNMIAAIADEEELLNGVMNDMMAAKPEKQLKLVQRNDFHGHNALDFSLENDQYSYDVKAIVVGKTLYVLSAVNPNGKEKHKDFEFFINSFELQNKSN